MEISHLNSRKRAEEGIFVPMCDTITGEPVDGKGTLEDGSPGWMVRGFASKTVQDELTKLSRESAKKRAAEKKKAGKVAMEDSEDFDEVVAARLKLHNSLIDNAMRYVIEAVNQKNEGVEPKTPEEIRAVLDMTFPVVEAETDEDGELIMIEGTIKGDDGEDVPTRLPSIAMTNTPFAKQIINGAEDHARFLGKPKTS